VVVNVDHDMVYFRNHSHVNVFYGALLFLLGVGYQGQTMVIINFGSTNGYRTLLEECKYLLIVNLFYNFQF